MKIYAFICSRSQQLKPITSALISKLSMAGIHVKLLVGKTSIFQAYQEAFNSIPEKDNNDIIILCHDDIKVINDSKDFIEILQNTLSNKETGFIGVAGTSHLSKEAIWWNSELWQKNKHKGFVFHGQDLFNCHSTYYGNPGRVVVLDGLFLAATVETIKKVGLNKPDYFAGDWDFYDIHYTFTAHTLGLKNKVVPIILLHNSLGELVGRTSWHLNRHAFINNNYLPIKCE